MKKRREGRGANRSLFSLRQYLIFFLSIAFVVTTCFLLFLRTLEVDIGDVRKSAVVTFGNVLFLSLVFTLVDALRRKWTVERPVKRILAAAQRLTGGDFSARIEPVRRGERRNELDVIIDDFNTMARELSGIETLRNDFISSVSHELKTPLAVIQNYATLLAGEDLTAAERVEYARSVSAACRRLSELITNILRLNKLENQQIFLEPKVFDLGEQLRACLLGFEEEWERKELVVETDLEELPICADAELLTLAWNNLFSNAVKFTAAGGTVAVTLRRRGEDAVVSVADSGCGMSPEVGAHIFEKFYQGDPAHSVQGNGLGLALVKRVVDIVGGEISVASAPGRGSVFTVTLRCDAREG